MKRIMGPNVAAAGSPLKKRPGMDDSKFLVSRGDPSIVLIEARISSERRSTDCMSTR